MFDTISFDTAENKALYGGILSGAGLTLLSIVCLGVRFCKLRRKRNLLRKKFDESLNINGTVLCLNVDKEVKIVPDLPPMYNQAISLEQQHERL